MAPTVCVAEFPMAGTTVSTLVRRRRGPESVTKRRRFALEEMLRTGTIVETLLPCEHCSRGLDYADKDPNCSVVEADRSGQYPTNVDESYSGVVAERRKDLLSLVIRTIILVQRNHIVQRRLNALRAETRRFLSSVLNSPEDQQRRSQVLSHSRNHSSFMKKVVSMLSLLLDADLTRNSEFHGAISSRGNRDRTDDESSSSDKSEDSDRSEC